MDLVFTQKKKKVEIAFSAPCEVKLYAVPVTYSTDGYAVSLWEPRDLEPVPACDQSSVELLAHLAVELKEDGAFTVREVFCKQGVSYAQN